MGRWSFAAVALVAAVPAAYLSYLMVSTFLNRAESLETMFQVLAATTLAFSALVTLLPVAILIFVRKPAPMDEAETPAVAGTGTPAGEMAVAADDAVEPVDIEEEFAADDEDADEFEDEFDIEDAEEDEFYAEGEDDFDEFDMDEFEDEK